METWSSWTKRSGQNQLLKILQKQLSFQGSIQTNLKFNYYPLVIREPNDYTLNVLMRSGYQGEQWQIERELNLMATPTELLWQPFSTLSGGEQTHVMLATLFAQDGYFPLLDEPTNHLDQDGRKQIAQYLKAKKPASLSLAMTEIFSIKSLTIH